MPFTKSKKTKAINIRRSDIIVIGKKEFIVRDNEPVSYVLSAGRIITLVPLKNTNAPVASLALAENEKLKIIRHK